MPRYTCGKETSTCQQCSLVFENQHLNQGLSCPRCGFNFYVNLQHDGTDFHMSFIGVDIIGFVGERCA